MKRSFDLLAAGSGLLILSPVFAWLIWRIKHEGPGPVFFRGRRSGKNGVEFSILKFRTMYENPESYAGPRVTAGDDGRVTPLGRWLRDTKLNELPQLWNVLVGEMSLVGPRPEDPEIVKTWPEEARREILSVRPGITSPASVIYRDEEKLLKAENVMDDYLCQVMPDKLRLDRLYVRNRGFLVDLDVIFYTLLAILPLLRKISIPTEALYNGGLQCFIKRYFSWFLVDVVVALGAVGAAGLLWRIAGPLNLGLGNTIGVGITIALIFSLVNSMLGLGRVSWRHARAAYAFDLALSSGLTTLLVLTLNWFWVREFTLPVGMILSSGLLAFLGFLAVRYRERLLTGLTSRWFWRREGGGLGERILIVGAGKCALLTALLLQKSNLSFAFSVVGMVDDDPTKQGMNIDGYRVLGLTHRIPSIVAAQDVGVILYAIERIQLEEQERILALCRQTNARLVIIPNLLSLFRERLSNSSQQATL